MLRGSHVLVAPSLTSKDVDWYGKESSHGGLCYRTTVQYRV